MMTSFRSLQKEAAGAPKITYRRPPRYTRKTGRLRLTIENSAGNASRKAAVAFIN
jgi:hypothetical protein